MLGGWIGGGEGGLLLTVTLLLSAREYVDIIFVGDFL